MIDLSTMPTEFYELAVAAAKEISRLRESAPTTGNDEVAKLRAEIECLKEENYALRIRLGKLDTQKNECARDKTNLILDVARLDAANARLTEENDNQNLRFPDAKRNSG